MTGRLTAAALALGALGACGSDGGQDFDSLAAEAGPPFATYEDIVVETDLPATGSASFEGFAAYERGGEPASVEQADMLSRLTMTADFGQDALTGRAYDFERADGVPVAGELAMEGEIVTDFVFPILDGRLAGTLTEGGRDVDYNLALFGAFGEDAEVIRGDHEGTASSAQGSVAIAGGLVAERIP